MTHGVATTTAQELKNVQAIADFELSARQHRSGMDALTDGISRAASHPLFVLAHFALFLVWMWVNVAGRPFDPFPFNLLTLVVSLEAIVLKAGFC